MPYPVPAGTESSYIGFALVSALIDLLIEQGQIIPADVEAMLRAARKSLNESGDALAQRGATFITDRMLAKK